MCTFHAFCIPSSDWSTNRLQHTSLISVALKSLPLCFCNHAVQPTHTAAGTGDAHLHVLYHLASFPELDWVYPRLDVFGEHFTHSEVDVIRTAAQSSPSARPAHSLALIRSAIGRLLVAHAAEPLVRHCALLWRPCQTLQAPVKRF